MLVSGGDDKSIKLWDRNTKRCVQTFMEHSGSVGEWRGLILGLGVEGVNIGVGGGGG